MSSTRFDAILKTTLTIAGRSQHLSRLTQLKLQIISNIWSWNCTRRRGAHIKLPFIQKVQPTESAGGETRGILSPPVSGNSSDSIFASVLKRFWMLIILESGGTPLQVHAVRFTYCCRLPPSTSRPDHLAKHFVAVQRDVVGCFNGPLCHLLTVHIDLDFVWRDGDVELRGIERGFN